MMTKNPDWLTIQTGIMEELLDMHQYDSKAAQEFMEHVSQQLVEAIKRGNPQITNSIVLQLNCLKALHGIQMEQVEWKEFMMKVGTILKIGVLFLL